MSRIFDQTGQQTTYIVIAIVVVVIAIGAIAYVTLSGGGQKENKAPIVIGEIGYKTGAGGIFYGPGHRGMML